MKKHIRVYTDYFNIGEQDFPLCEWCGYRKAVDVNHIIPRGMGGSKNKDYIENLVGMCRDCHQKFEAKKISKEELTERHLDFMHKNIYT